MNFLAHLFLSGSPAAPTYSDVLLGNFIADSVPGKQLENYPTTVQAGIRLHRAIDTFTDQHPVVRRATQRLRTAGYGKYAGVISDMFLDHFLARHFQDFTTEQLADFAQRVYTELNSRQRELPPRVQHFLPYMTTHNWLLSYADLESITRALTGLSRRASPGSGMETAVVELRANYGAYEVDFQEFFPQLQRHVAELFP